jgi:hypothetical protein
MNKNPPLIQGVDFRHIAQKFARLSVAGGDAQNFASKLYTAIFYIESYPFIPLSALPKPIVLFVLLRAVHGHGGPTFKTAL